jgi:hypothetical protein
MGNRWYGSQFVHGKGPWKRRKLTCRFCGREASKCWHCFVPKCDSCSSTERCPHCQRPPRPIVNGLPERLFHYLEGHPYGASEPLLARLFGVSMREIRRAVRKMGDKITSSRTSKRSTVTRGGCGPRRHFIRNRPK